MESRKTVDTNKITDAIIFLVLLVSASAVTLILFDRQTLGNPNSYHSDMKAYILEMQGLDSGYSFPYPVFFKFAAFLHLFTGAEFAVALATMILNSLGMVITKFSLEYFTKTRNNVLISFVSVGLFFISMLASPMRLLAGEGIRYLGIYTANPFHNATYMAARPFAILAFAWYAKLLDVYETWDRENLKDYILFSLFLLLTTMTKPSFTIVLVGTAGLIMVYRIIKSRFKNFVPSVYLGLTFLPTFADLLYQYKGVFVPGEGQEGGIGFSIGEIWSMYCGNIPLAICLAIGFPVLVLVLNFREVIKTTVARFSYQIYLMGFAMAFLLYEKGFRKPDFNFCWGYMYGIFFSFVGALIILITQTIKFKAEKPADRRAVRGGILIAIQWLAWLAHLACGLWYFSGIFKGNMYY